MSEQPESGPREISFLADGDRISGRFYPSQRDAAHATVLFLDGFPGSKDDPLKLGFWLPLAGFHLMTFHWRGTFDSDGRYTLAAAQADIAAALAYLRSESLPEGVTVDPDRIVLGGWSFGGGLALTYAATDSRIRFLFTVAGTDIGRFAHQIRTDDGLRSTVTQAYRALAQSEGPVRFDGDDPMADLMANGPAYDLRRLAPELADRRLLLIGGWQDTKVPVETHLLPLYRALQDAGTVCAIRIFTTNHFFSDRQFTMAKTIWEWLRRVLPATDAPGRDATVSLREITADNARDVMNLKVTDEQRQFVASNEISIAQAYFQRDKAWFRAIYADETPVGFLMLYDDPEEEAYFLWRFMIDVRYQGMGYGRQAIELLIDHVKTRPGATELKLSYVPGDGSPHAFYKRLGFVDTGEKEGIEMVMKRTW